MAHSGGENLQDQHMVAEQNRAAMSCSNEVSTQGSRVSSCVAKSRSYALDACVCVAALVALFIATSSDCSAQASTPPTFDDVQNSIRPITNPVVGLSYLVATLWHHLMHNSSAAILLSAALASVFALLGIRNQRALARLRETFATINDDNWDKDVIAAQTYFSSIKLELKDNLPDIAKYCIPDADPDSAHSKRCQALSNILSDYENVALGVRHHIIDEAYLFRWMRSTVIADWHTLSPLVAAHRYKRDNPNVYVEFEGLAAAWRQGRSFRNGRKLQRSNRTILVK